MVEYKPFNLELNTVLAMSYTDVTVLVYNAIPSHELADISPEDIKFLLGYYPALYSRLSRQYCLILENYDSRTHDKYYLLKNMYEQALKVTKFQYDSLSRKITVDKEELESWGGLGK